MLNKIIWKLLMSCLMENLFLFCGKHQIKFKSPPEVQSLSNVIKITSRHRNHRTTNLAARMSRLHAAVGAPLPEPAWLCQWQSGSLRRDQLPGVAVVAVETLHRSEAPNIKSRHMTGNPNLTAPRRQGSLRQSSVDYIHMDEVEEDRSLDDKLEEESSPSTRAPHLWGLKNPNLN